jgi:hypothetical protein
MKREIKTMQTELDKASAANIDNYQALLGLKESDACDILMSIHNVVYGKHAQSPRMRQWEMRDLPKLIQSQFTIRPLKLATV